jgi:3-deoxy-7-phosphoheptulonate synthase
VVLSYSNILSDSEIKSLTDYLHSQNIRHHFAVLGSRSVLITSKNLDASQKETIRTAGSIPLRFFEISTPFQLVARSFKPENSIVKAGNLEIGGRELTLIAGPCAVESEEQIMTIAGFLHDRGIRFLRGGAYKPRSSPYSFQGLKKEGLRLLKKAADKYSQKVVTELMDLSFLEDVYHHTDIIQIGTRNMFNYELLKELGKTDKPILLKRGLSAKIEEWLLAAEYILSGGNEKVILCERGIRSFADATRNTLDLGGLALCKELSHLPVIADPSQATGIRSLVSPMSLAAVAAGADGLMIEVHNQPEKALSDGEQSLTFPMFENLLDQLLRLFSPELKTFDFAKKSLNFAPDYLQK